MFWSDSQLLAFCWLPALIEQKVAPNILSAWPECLRKQYKLPQAKTGPLHQFWTNHKSSLFAFFHHLTPGLLSRCSHYVEHGYSWTDHYTTCFDHHLAHLPVTTDLTTIIHSQ